MNKVKTILVDFKWFCINFYKKIQHDKKLHLIAGAVISLIVMGFTGNVFLTLLIGMLSGLVKEFLDSKGMGTVDFNDFTATATGSAIVTLLFLI